MSRVTSLTSMPEAQLNRLIKRLGLLLFIGIVAFAAFYAIDRFRMPQQSIADTALTKLEDAVRANPADIASRGKLADTYFAKGRYEDAITQYGAIIETGNDVELATYGRARAYSVLQRYDEALADFETVIGIASGGEMAAVDPILEGSFYGEGEIYLKQDKAAEAVKVLEKALVINRSDADALMLIGKAYEATGDIDKAGKALRRVVEFVPIGWAEPYQAMADMYARAGEQELAAWAAAMVTFENGGADEAVAKLTELADGPAALDASIGLAVIAESRGQLDIARAWYQKALAIDPQNAAATLGMGRVGAGPASPMPSLPVPGSTGGNG